MLALPFVGPGRHFFLDPGPFFAFLLWHLFAVLSTVPERHEKPRMELVNPVMSSFLVSQDNLGNKYTLGIVIPATFFCGKPNHKPRHP